MPEIIFKENPSSKPANCDNQEPDVEYPQQEPVRFTDSEEMIAWLREKGYTEEEIEQALSGVDPEEEEYDTEDELHYTLTQYEVVVRTGIHLYNAITDHFSKKGEPVPDAFLNEYLEMYNVVTDADVLNVYDNAHEAVLEDWEEELEDGDDCPEGCSHEECTPDNLK